MITKTWTIGEYCQGGVLTTEIHDDGKLVVIAKEWDMSAGNSKTSDQSNAKEFDRFETDIKKRNSVLDIEDFVTGLCTYYYGSEVANWFRNNI